MQLEIITPETKIFNGEAKAVQFPGMEGSFQVLKGHAPIISALTEGDVKIDLPSAFEANEDTNPLIKTDKSDNKVIRVGIKGGVIEMQNDRIIVLAE